MKSLSLTTPRVLFVIGIPGAGKTQFAEKFSETFGAPFVEADKIRRAITREPTYSIDEQKAVDEIVMLQLAELLKTKKTILVEAATEARVDRANLVKLVKTHGYEPMLVWVQTEPATAQQRATKSLRGSKKTFIMPVQRYDQLLQRFTAPHVTERAVVISGKHTYASQARIVLKRLAGPHREAAEQQSVSQPRQAIRGNSIKIN